MKISRDLARYINDLIYYTGHVDEEGNAVKRETWDKQHYWGFIDIRKELGKECCELGFISSETKKAMQQEGLNKFSLTDERIEWVPAAQEVEMEGKGMIKIDAVSIKAGEFQPNSRAVACLKFYYDQRNGLPELSEDDFKTLEELINSTM